MVVQQEEINHLIQFILPPSMSNNPYTKSHNLRKLPYRQMRENFKIEDTSVEAPATCIRFVENFVTEIRHRPQTTIEEKALLFYEEKDFRKFCAATSAMKNSLIHQRLLVLERKLLDFPKSLKVIQEFSNSQEKRIISQKKHSILSLNRLPPDSLPFLT
jgi:hypothetical protein